MADDLAYTKLFDAGAEPRAEPLEFDPPVPEAGAHAGLGERDEDVYVYGHDPGIELAVNVALTAGRPLLVRGEPGCGKSTLAGDVARRLRWRFFDLVVTSRTSAQDLLWRFDAVRRLADAQAGGALAARVGRPELYVEPGILWWAYEPATAPHRGRVDAQGKDIELEAEERAVAPGISQGRDPRRCVVLLDEIDKAEPDVPNDLLEALGARRFVVAETGKTVSASASPLVVITTNRERDLPAAFLRRCVALDLALPEDLVPFAESHFPDAGTELLREIHDLHRALTATARRERRRPPSIAEYLDAVRACLALAKEQGKDAWRAVARAVFTKDPPPADEVPGAS